MHARTQAIRDAAAKAETVLDEYSIQSGMREDMYKAMLAFAQRVEKAEVWPVGCIPTRGRSYVHEHSVCDVAIAPVWWPLLAK